MRFLTLGAIAAAAVLSTGCTTQFGKQFNSTALKQLTPGAATRSDLVAQVGPIEKPEILTMKKDLGDKELPNPVVVEIANYYFSDKEAPSAKAGVRSSRNASVILADSKIVSYRMSSTFANESTDFDEAKIGAIRKGQTTEAEVLALMGQPSGRATYPFAKEAGGSAMSWYNLSFNIANNKIQSKLYVVYLDARHVVSDFDLKISEK